MILSKDAISHGMRDGARALAHVKRDGQRMLSATFGGAHAQFLILGGAIAAPILSAAGWVGLLLPATAGLHQAAAGLLTAGMVGLGIALIEAHNSKDAARATAE